MEHEHHLEVCSHGGRGGECGQEGAQLVRLLRGEGRLRGAVEVRVESAGLVQ